MATFSSILVPSGSGATKVAALATVTSSAELAFAKNQILRINSTKDITVKFGNTGMAAAAATDYRIPANTVADFDLGDAFTCIRVFNLDASATDVYILPLCRN